MENLPGIVRAPSSDEKSFFQYDAVQQTALQKQKTWARNPHYFSKVNVSTLALIKMTVHCRSGAGTEVMGMISGKTLGDKFIVLDSFALPVEGTETRVNAQAEAYEYMVDFVQASKQVGREEHVVGWYHSHPGYGCWMSGIDCSTQTLNQQYTEPFLAIVLDPIRTCCSGKVELGAYRTYPQSYIPPKKKMYKYVVPINKSLDFGAHAKKYYSLETSLFKSHHDSNLLVALWNTCWINTLSLACIQTNHDYASKQIFDVTQKLEEGEELRVRRGRTCTVVVPDLATSCPNDMSHALHVTHDAIRLSSERIKGTAAFTLKELLFNKTPKL